MIIRVARGDNVHVGLAIEPVEHLRTVIEERADGFLVVEIAGLVLQILNSGVPRILRRRWAGFIAGDPQHAAGERRGAAEDRRFFHHDHLQPVLGGNDGGGKPTGSRANHQHVTFLHPIL